VEILKFSEPPKRSSNKTTRKKNGMMPLLSIVATVALVGGMSTTLAGTITLNTGTGVEFGQGVVTAAACDTSMSILPTAQYETTAATSFIVSKITIAGLGLIQGSAGTGTGCKGKVLTIRAYELNSATPMVWDTGTASAIIVQLPDTSTMVAGDILKSANPSITIEDVTSYDNPSNTTTSSTVQKFSLGGLRFSSNVVRFTIESSDPTT
jgi:hypothetical protein